MARYWVYMLKCSDGSLYAGMTSDLEKRIRLHNEGRASKYTRARGPVALAYAERAASKSGALRREFQIKRLSRSAKLLLCSSYGAKRRHSVR